MNNNIQLEMNSNEDLWNMLLIWQGCGAKSYFKKRLGTTALTVLKQRDTNFGGWGVSCQKFYRLHYDGGLRANIFVAALQVTTGTNWQQRWVDAPHGAFIYTNGWYKDIKRCNFRPFSASRQKPGSCTLDHL